MPRTTSDRVSVAEAAEILGVSREFIRIGMQRGVLPIGTAVKMSSIWTYYINRPKLMAYKAGEKEGGPSGWGSGEPQGK